MGNLDSGERLTYPPDWGLYKTIRARPGHERVSVRFHRMEGVFYIYGTGSSEVGHAV